MRIVGLFMNFLLCSSILCTYCIAQSPYYSESLIRYDLLTHKTSKPIPFDRSFTLVIDKLASRDIVVVNAYQAEYKNGNRRLVENTYFDCHGRRDTAEIKDIQLKINPYNDTLQLFFPPLKPNVDFDIHVVRGLSKECRSLLMKVNAELATGSVAASNSFSKFWNCAIDKLTNTTYVGFFSFNEYKAFYDSILASHYSNISNPINFDSSGSLTEIEIQAIDNVTTINVSDFKDGYLLLEASKRGLFPDVVLGNRDIKKVFLTDADALTSLSFGHVRQLNLESNIIFFDSVLMRLDRAISKGITQVTISGAVVFLNSIRANLVDIKTDLEKNISYLKKELGSIGDSINKENRLKQGTYLAGNTLSDDLKSAGGSILFLDAGITNIFAPGLTGGTVYIPKLYWGLSIYFRPIDKNTRRSKFPRRFDPVANKGCKMDSLTKLFNYGPDYGIVARRSIWQHLSLNVGLTVGSMSDKGYENFYNNTSLLIGPAYRFARAFKISSGLALLRRSSQNPFVSEKKVIAASYLSLSVDVDFLQGIKDITTILFK